MDGRAAVQQGQVQGYLNFVVDRVQVDAPRNRDHAMSRARWCCCNTRLGVALFFCVNRESSWIFDQFGICHFAQKVFAEVKSWIDRGCSWWDNVDLLRTVKLAEGNQMCRSSVSRSRPIE